MSNKKPRGGNGPVPGTRRKTVPIARASGPAEYTAGQQEMPVILTSLADMVCWAQNWARSRCNGYLAHPFENLPLIFLTDLSSGHRYSLSRWWIIRTVLPIA